ncbi:MAG: hypothetical protein K2W95_05710 [Candidatus Obscuribacterales bacterium]|nr:hypothetical protein [Candidatus Obscuribacterales bacterium]
MGQAVLLNLDGRPVWSTECSFRITHEGKEVAVVGTQTEVVRWFERKRASLMRWAVAELSTFGLILCPPDSALQPLYWHVQPLRKSDCATH